MGHRAAQTCSVPEAMKHSGLLNGKPHAVRLPASRSWVDHTDRCRPDCGDVSRRNVGGKGRNVDPLRRAVRPVPLNYRSLYELTTADLGHKRFFAKPVMAGIPVPTCLIFLVTRKTKRSVPVISLLTPKAAASVPFHPSPRNAKTIFLRIARNG